MSTCGSAEKIHKYRYIKLWLTECKDFLRYLAHDKTRGMDTAVGLAKFKEKFRGHTIQTRFELTF